MWIVGRERGGYGHQVQQGKGEGCGPSGGRFRRKWHGRAGHGLRKRSAKGTEVWQEADPEQEIPENLFGDGGELYKDVEEYDGFILGVGV